MRFKLPNMYPRKWLYVQIQLDSELSTIRYTLLDKKIGKQATPIVWTEVATIDELIQKEGKTKPILLHFTGFGILSRLVSYQPNFKETLIVNGNESDFLFSTVQFKHNVGVSFMRKSLADPFLDACKQNGAFIWSVHCGPACLLALNTDNMRFELDYSCEIKNGELISWSKSTDPYGRNHIDQEHISVENAYCLAMQQQVLHENSAYSQSLSKQIEEETRGNYFEYIRFLKLGIGILSFILFSLVANYFILNHLNQQVATLETEVSSYGENLAYKERLIQEKNRKLKLVENSGIKSGTYLFQLIDELCESVPTNIQLTGLEVFPLTEPLKPKRKVALNTQQIKVNGFTQSSTILDDWIEKINRFSWITGVELMNYERVNNQKAVFYLILKVGV